MPVLVPPSLEVKSVDVVVVDGEDCVNVVAEAVLDGKLVPMELIADTR